MNQVPGSQFRFDQWMKTFAEAVEEQAAVLELTPEQVEEVRETAQSYSVALSNSVKNRAAYRSSITEKQQAKEAAEKLASELNARFRTNPAVTPQVLSRLGLPVYKDNAVRQEPEQVLHLVAKSTTMGKAKLKFDRNGNPQRTTFIVEYAMDPNGPYQYLTTSMSSRITLTGLDPHKAIFVRIVAVVRRQEGLPSEPVILFAGSSAHRESLLAA